MVNIAPPPAVTASPQPYTHHIDNTTPPASQDKLTLCGFEGPEKLLEIWFKMPDTTSTNSHHQHQSTHPDGDDEASTHSSNSSPPSLTHRAPSLSLTDNSDTSDTESIGASSTISTPTHPYLTGNAHPTTTATEWSYTRTGLRRVARPVWESMLDIVQCKVLSVITNEHADAYLLSESSMFVYANRVILKTCGTTTLLHAVPRILEIAAAIAGMQGVEALFYSRKAFLFPERQVYPHGKWGDEVAYLDGVFDEEEGSWETSGYVVGKVNGDHWCMYQATPLVKVLNANGDEVLVSSQDVEGGEEDEEEEEVTLEIMMQDLNPEVTKLFWRSEEEQRQAKEQEELDAVYGKLDLSGLVSLAKQPQGINGVHKNVRKAERRLLKETGIQDIYPCSMVDDFLFDPCGYSLNGLLGPYYWTIHVTPEDICSYASFETTIPVRKFYRPTAADAIGGDVDGTNLNSTGEKGATDTPVAKPKFRQGSASEYECYEDVIHEVLERFQPGKFSVTLFSRKHHGKRHGRDGRGLMDGCKIDGFKRTDKIVHDVGKWDLVFSHYCIF
ncbi:spermidine resistance protein [Podochytrium sp. JEL0797]|nr:spermidine resistance protein [Podochytrium sp. JEL0797]